jgi:hypothetical protein
MATRDMSKSNCPTCGKAFNAATNALDDDETPEPGDWTMCLGCGEVLAFDATLKPRALTEAEQREAAADPRIRKLQHAHRVMKFLKAQQSKAAQFTQTGKKQPLALHPRERSLVERVMAAHPDLTFEQALAMLRNAGM